VKPLLNTKREHLVTFFKQSQSRLGYDYKKIKSNIEFASYKKNYKSFSIISANNGEGATTTCLHLAMTFAKDGKKVLLIDGNLQKPILNKLFLIENDYGLSNVLIGQKKFADVLNMTEFADMKLITAGQGNNHFKNLFNSSAMENLLEEAKQSFDYIFIDNSAIFDGETGKIIASKTDGTVFVVRNKKTEVKQMIEAKKVLKTYDVNLLGVILNDKNPSLSKKLVGR